MVTRPTPLTAAGFGLVLTAMANDLDARLRKNRPTISTDSRQVLHAIKFALIAGAEECLEQANGDDDNT